MAATYVRAFEMTAMADTMEFGFWLPKSQEDGGGREYMLQYSIHRFAVEMDPPAAAPSGDGHPDIGGQFIQIMGT